MRLSPPCPFCLQTAELQPPATRLPALSQAEPAVQREAEVGVLAAKGGQFVEKTEPGGWLQTRWNAIFW